MPEFTKYALAQIAATVLACAIVFVVARWLLTERSDEKAWLAREREWQEEERAAGRHR